MKTLMIIALAVFMGVSGVAAADEHMDRVVELEKRIAEMTEALKALQEEVAVLKQEETAISKTTEGVSPAAEDRWTDRIILNGQVRFRGYHLSNMWSFDDGQKWDQWNVFRARGSLRTTAKATDNITAVLQILKLWYSVGLIKASNPIQTSQPLFRWDVCRITPQ